MSRLSRLLAQGSLASMAALLRHGQERGRGGALVGQGLEEFRLLGQACSLWPPLLLLQSFNCRHLMAASGIVRARDSAAL